jgi:hypothetical protein
MVPAAWIEQATSRLEGGCSTAELTGALIFGEAEL